MAAKPGIAAVFPAFTKEDTIYERVKVTVKDTKMTISKVCTCILSYYTVRLISRIIPIRLIENNTIF
jgi:hypothetical protein